MKKQTLVFALLFFCLTGFTQIPSYVPTNGLVGWYPFNSNANDLSGNGNNGFAHGGNFINDRNNIPNAAYSFNGISDYISSSFAPFTNAPFSVSAWIKADSLIYQPVVTFGDSIQNNSRVSLATDAGSGLLDMSTFGANNIQSDSAKITTTGWHHIVLVCSGYSTGQVQFYVDGNLFQTNTLSGGNMPFPLNNTYFSIGRDIGCSGNCSTTYAKAKIDDIGIWTRALNQNEVTQLYNSCSNASASITPQSATTFCQGGSVVLQANSGSNYHWSTTSTAQNITVSQSGNYLVTVSDNSGCSATASQTVTVNPLPSLTFTLPAFVSNNQSSFSLNGSPSGGTYSGATGISGNSFNPSQAGLGSKTITYTYTNGNNCSNTANASTIFYDTTGMVCTSFDTLTTHLSVTDTLLINVNLTGINPPNNIVPVQVFPNPAHDHLEVVNLGNMTGYTIKIANTLGQIVFNQVITQPSYNIDLNGWTGNGVYILYILDLQQTIKSTKEIVLQ